MMGTRRLSEYFQPKAERYDAPAVSAQHDAVARHQTEAVQFLFNRYSSNDELLAAILSSLSGIYRQIQIF